MATITEEHNRLLEEINRLQQEKRSLNVRLQGVGVLAKVLQDSQDENSKLKQEVIELKSELEGTSVDITASGLSLQTTPSMAADQERCFLSQPEDNLSSLSESSFEYVNSLSQEEPLPSGSFPHCDLHIKELRSGFKTIKSESDALLDQAKNMLELIGNVNDRNESADLASKVSTLIKRIAKHAKDVKTRQTFLQGLATEEEQLKEKFMAMEMEQVSQEKVMEDLKVQLKDDKEELESIKEQIQFLCEAVVVNKEDASSIEEFSSSETASSTSRMSSLSNLSAKDKEQGELRTPNLCRKCRELVQQLEQVKREKEQAIRQKEEILDVNHAWDAQYKKLKTETGKEIADLKYQIDMLQNSDMWKSATAMLEQERQAKQQALDEKSKLEEKCRKLEERLSRLPLQEKYQLQQTPGPSSKMSFVSSPTKNQQLSTSSQSAALPEEPPQDMIKEIEVVKQQLRVYADDFAAERQDRERMQGEKEQLESEVRDLKEQVSVLKEQISLYEEDFKKESQEKDRLRRQLNFQREGSDPEARLSDMTRKAQAVAERQARLRALREQYNREERHLLQDQQEFQQSARVMAIQSESQNTLHDVYIPRPWTYHQDIHPRGPSEPHRSPSDMFHGGDVQADSRHLVHGQEVTDYARNDYCCPRCFRLFPRNDEESYKKHTLKCIE